MNGEKKVRAILIGAGNRGNAYTREMLKVPEKFQIVAVAEPDERLRAEYLKKLYSEVYITLISKLL